MDRKTFETLSQQIEEARIIVDQINEIEVNIQDLKYVDEISFEGLEKQVSFYIHHDFIDAVKAAYIEQAKVRITLLEGKLAEI